MVGGVDAVLIVVDHDITENDGFDLFHGQLFCVDAVEFFLLERSEEAFHPGIVITFSCTTHALDSAVAGK